MGGSEESTGDGVDIPDDGYRLDPKRVVVIVVTVAVVVVVFVVCGSPLMRKRSIFLHGHTQTYEALHSKTKQTTAHSQAKEDPLRPTKHTHRPSDLQ